MNRMTQEFKKMLEMQRELDNAILIKGARSYDSDISSKTLLALFVEVGELFNELPTTFKHWKKTAVDNKEKALIEYIDCLHFALSLLNYYFNYFDIDPARKIYKLASLDYSHYKPDYPYTIDDIQIDLKEISSPIENINDAINKTKSLFYIGHYLGFEWKEIYQAYIDKNKINHERQERGY